MRTHISTTTHPLHPPGYLRNFPASCGSYVPAEALGSVRNMLPLVSELDPAPGCPMNHQQQEIMALPFAVPTFSLQVQQAVGKGLQTSACFCCPPTHWKWWARTRAYGSLAVLSGFIVAAEDPQQMQLLVNDFRMGLWK